MCLPACEYKALREAQTKMCGGLCQAMFIYRINRKYRSYFSAFHMFRKVAKAKECNLPRQTGSCCLSTVSTAGKAVNRTLIRGCIFICSFKKKVVLQNMNIWIYTPHTHTQWTLKLRRCRRDRLLFNLDDACDRDSSRQLRPQLKNQGFGI